MKVVCVMCSECGRVYPLEDDDIQIGGDCPSDDCPANNENPMSGTLRLQETAGKGK